MINIRCWNIERLSNNWQPDSTDLELITIYLFGHLQDHYKQKRIHQYISQHFAGWFPDLPSYQAFNQRLNQISEALKVMVFQLLAGFQETDIIAWRFSFFKKIVWLTRCRLCWQSEAVRWGPKVGSLRSRSRLLCEQAGFIITESKCTFWRENNIGDCRLLKLSK